MAAHGVTARDRYNQSWASGSDFPIVCETCLGPNPYVRMTKHASDKECKTCQRPFTVFRWKAGNDGRHKKTEVCQTCAKLKNVCQTCLLDLEYGLPTQVRDAALNAGAGVLPSNEFNRDYYIQQVEQQMAAGQIPFGRAPDASAAIAKLARNTPYYKRNAPHICSFFVKGECTRGDTCPYRHEMPAAAENDDLAHQNIVDRYKGENDPVAEKMLKKVDNFKPRAPEDPHIMTLYVGGVSEEIKEDDLRSKFYIHGEIKSIRLVPKSNCAFVSFATRLAAETAFDATYNQLTIRGKHLKVAWGKPQTLDPSAQTRDGSYVGTAATYIGGAGAAAAAASSALAAPPPGLTATPQAPYYPSMDPNIMGSRPSYKPINLAPE